MRPSSKAEETGHFTTLSLTSPAGQTKNICWKCRASKGGAFDYKEAGAEAAWRGQRLEGYAFYGGTKGCWHYSFHHYFQHLASK